MGSGALTLDLRLLLEESQRLAMPDPKTFT